MKKDRKRIAGEVSLCVQRGVVRLDPALFAPNAVKMMRNCDWVRLRTPIMLR